MAFGDSGMMSSGAVFQKMILTAGAAAIVTVGAWTADTLRGLTVEVAALRLSMVTLATRVDGMPPRDLLLRVELLEKRQQLLDDRLTRMGNRIHAKLGIEE